MALSCMNYKLKLPTLKEQCLIQLGTYWLNVHLAAESQDSRAHRLIVHLPSPQRFRAWDYQKLLIEDKVREIGIPEILQLQLLDMISELILKIWLWNDYCIDMKYPFDEPVTHWSCWFHFTVYGNIDKNKMLENYVGNAYLVTSRSIFNYLMFRQIAEWCVEKYIFIFRNSMSVSQRHDLYIRHRNNFLVIYWLYYDDCFPYLADCNNYNVTKTVHENLFVYAMRYEHKVAVEYCWYKLTDAEKKRCAFTCSEFAASRRIPDLLCSSLEYLFGDSILELYQKCPDNMLISFITWPYDQLFEYWSELLSEHLCTCSFFIIFDELVRRVLSCCRICKRYKKLLYNFSFLCPKQSKGHNGLKHSSSRAHFRFLMRELLLIDKDFCSAVLKNLS